MKYVGTLAAGESTLADGRVIQPGVEINLTKDDENEKHNQRLIASGKLVAVKQTKEA